VSLPLANKALQEGITHHQAGRALEAAACYARVRSFAPRLWEGHHFGGMAALLLGRSDEALALFSQALVLNPKAADTAVALGLTQLACGRAGEAEVTLRRASKLAPRNAEVWDKLGLILSQKHDLPGALSCHAEAVRLAPRNAACWYNQGATLLTTDRIPESLVSFERALSIESSHTGALSGRALCLYKLHRVPEAVALYERVLASDPRNHQAMSYRLLALNNLDVDPMALAEAHRQYGRLVGGPVPGRFVPRPSISLPLRVGILSADLRRHSVAYFMRPFLETAAAQGIELFLYHDHGREDEVSAAFRALCHTWRNLAGSVNEVVERQILSDAPSVLIDLSGHTGSNRMALLARRLAPVQVTYLGYPNTTGLASMDFRLVDALTDPEGEADTWHTERLVRFAPTAWCYSPPGNAPAPVGARDLQRPVTFGSFNHFTKVTDELLRQWSLLLAEVPGSRLLLKSSGLEQPVVAEQVRGRLRAAGINLASVDLHGLRQDPAEHLALYGSIDVALDPSPYNGTTTTCEALWMGVPVVVLVGHRHASRVGLSLLSSIGRSDWTASSWEEYRAIARRLACAPVATDLRGEALRAAMQGSVLMDGAGQSARFWAAIKACAGL
jgi:predicted O-linked N-acetylglucosamine transferase (SPINDLY family)